MKFVSKCGYRTFLGRVFFSKRPTDVADKATIAALLRHPEFERYEDEQAKEQPQATPAAVLKRPVLSLGKRR